MVKESPDVPKVPECRPTERHHDELEVSLEYFVTVKCQRSTSMSVTLM